MKLTQCEVKYLKALYDLQSGCEGIFISISDVASYVRVSMPTAVEYLKNLEKKGYIIYLKRFGVSLSSNGFKLIKKLIWKHRVLETCIYTTTKIDPDRICNAIRNIELYLDDEFIRDIYKRLGKPKCCPHGREIPVDVEI